MSEFEVFLSTFISSTFNLSDFLQNPGFQERVHLTTVNLLGMIPPLGVFTLLWLLLAKQRLWVARIAASLFFVLPLVLRTTMSYAYDTPFGYLALVSDVAGLLYLTWKLGATLYRHEPFVAQIVVTLGIAILLAVLATVLRLNGLLAVPTAIGHALWTALLVCVLWRDSLRWPRDLGIKSLSAFRPRFVIYAAVFFLPLLPYIGAAGPPDADATSMAEMIGYLLQGQDLHHVETGLPGEWMSIRYPAGLPAFCWTLAQLLNIRASEALMIVWIVTWLLFLCATLMVAKRIHANGLVTILFVFTTTVTGAFGLAGGQIQEMLTFALGLLLIYFVLEGAVLVAAVCLAAGLCLHPIVAIPFGLVLGYFYLETALKTQKANVPQLLVGSALVLIAAAYCYFLGIAGESIKPTQIAEMLQRLTWPTFVSGIWFWLVSDTHGLFVFVLPPILYGLWFRSNSEANRLSVVFLVWLCGALLINGLFGDTKGMNFTATFQAGFSVVGIWALSMGWCFSRISLSLSKATGCRRLVGGAFVLLWALFCFPGFYLKPLSVFVTHSDVRMGRWIEKNLPAKGTLIANLVPPSGPWEGSNRISFSYDRGNSVRDTVFSRLAAEHQVKAGHLVDRLPYMAAFKQGIEANIRNYRSLGVTFLLVPARPETESFVASSPVLPEVVFGSTYLFRVSCIDAKGSPLP